LITYQTNEEAIAWLREHARPDDFVLLKGSRMYRMEQIVAGLSA
jgi:UDP-N-acetylmuramyl pentapeptide synthase